MKKYLKQQLRKLMTFHTKSTFHVLAERSHALKSIESSFQNRSQAYFTSAQVTQAL